MVDVKREDVSYPFFATESADLKLVHPHPPIPLYTDADGDKGHVRTRKMKFDVVDLRGRR